MPSVRSSPPSFPSPPETCRLQEKIIVHQWLIPPYGREKKATAEAMASGVALACCAGKEAVSS